MSAQSCISSEGQVSGEADIAAGCGNVGADRSLGCVESHRSAAAGSEGIVDRDRAALKCQRAVEGNRCDDRDRTAVGAPDRDRAKIPRQSTEIRCRQVQNTQNITGAAHPNSSAVVGLQANCSPRTADGIAIAPEVNPVSGESDIAAVSIESAQRDAAGENVDVAALSLD